MTLQDPVEETPTANTETQNTPVLLAKNESRKNKNTNTESDIDPETGFPKGTLIARAQPVDDNAPIYIPEVPYKSPTRALHEGTAKNPDGTPLKIAFHAAMSTCGNGSFPELLPYKKARIDVFMRYSGKELLNKEFMILSQDGVVKSIGLVSSGGGGNSTGAGRYYLYGIDRDHRQIDPSSGEDGSYMPYDFMLANKRPVYWGEKRNKTNQPPVEAEYSMKNFHGTDDYGVGSFGDPASHGCIRNITDHSGNKGTLVFETDYQGNIIDKGDPIRMRRYGLHRINWKYLNPFDWDRIDIFPNRIRSTIGTAGERLSAPLLNWPDDHFSMRDKPTKDGLYDLARGGQIGMQEMSKKTRIEFYDSNRLLKNKYKKQLLEKMYEDVVGVLKDALKKGKKGYIDFGVTNNVNGYKLDPSYIGYRLDPSLLNKIEEAELADGNP